MPPRKSDIAKAAATEEAVTPAAAAPSNSTPAKAEPHKEKDGINLEVCMRHHLARPPSPPPPTTSKVGGNRTTHALTSPQDLNLPKSIVTRLAKGALPPNTQIQGNAMLAMTKSATVFVGYLATHANEYAQAANRKTVAPADVLRALEDLEFGEFRPRLEAELAQFNENAAAKRAGAKKGREKGAGKEDVLEGEGEGEEGRPRAKRVRLEEGKEVDGGEGEVEVVLDEQEVEEEEEEHEEEDQDDEVEEDGEEEDDLHEGHEDDVEERQVNGKVEDEALDNGEDSD